jgi:hypothetical protein
MYVLVLFLSPGEELRKYRAVMFVKTFTFLTYIPTWSDTPLTREQELQDLSLSLTGRLSLDALAWGRAHATRLQGPRKRG